MVSPSGTGARRRRRNEAGDVLIGRPNRSGPASPSQLDDLYEFGRLAFRIAAMELDRNRGIEALTAGGLAPSPLYKEVKSRVTRGLAAGEWKAGEALPSESRLAERFGVSIGTVRKAIDELVAERILLRQQGRGTFVATHTEDRTLFYFFHIVRKDGSRELPVTELLSFRRARANAAEEERLGVAKGAPVLRIQNLL